jgi:hypothetical protein
LLNLRKIAPLGLRVAFPKVLAVFSKILKEVGNNTNDMIRKMLFMMIRAIPDIQVIGHLAITNFNFIRK